MNTRYDIHQLQEEEMELNMGPQHPSTHGVLRVVLKLDGETIKKATPYVGYLHRGTEKLGEVHKYYQNVPHTDRMDYLAAPSNNLAYVQAVEKLLGIEDEIPERAKYMRVIMAELARIASHLVWLGTHAMDVGAISVFLYCFREREMIMSLFEEYCGARLTTSMMKIGGMPADLPDNWLDHLEDFLRIMPRRIGEYEALLTENPIWIERTRGVGVISAEDAVSFGLTGACLRGSGVNYDVRKAQPYQVYDRIDFDVPLGSNGDVYDRYLVRVEEMKQALRIIRQAVDQMPDGPYVADLPEYVLPRKVDAMTTIEGQTRHFVLTIHGFNAPPGEIYKAVEAPKGELGYYIVSDGSNKPYRMHVRAPSYYNLASLPRMSEGGSVQDVVAVIGSIDIVLGEVDR
ncbi:NADH dehydrogenase I, D subunit [Thermobaculum terrenum ATCC BAA-798]|uniref:NADH-quinone oxidoreductase subunit D n=1 Tax=Thermobaculum terrenum (strain ATCC BAA-798 / CCMEE 7001 / YNP1) TaxID=525904 RepID=D1CCD2_THET1|nr:NADH dehydrogenase (quinone) subunit D [Thermobaculum terrenum]ACZ42447.1 NADH dehydrogenase I, D subunit [Thermobaculum terrenum ATCC BAA-798]